MRKTIIGLLGIVLGLNISRVLSVQPINIYAFLTSLFTFAIIVLFVGWDDQ